MESYWYSTDGMDQKRLSDRHLDLLDRAYEGRTRIEILDDTVFGSSVCAIANPFLGTLTAGDIHYGLYRHPPLGRNSESNSFDSLVLFDSTAIFLEEPAATCVSSGSSSSALESNRNQRNRFVYYHRTGCGDDSMMGFAGHQRSRLFQFLSQSSDTATPITTGTTTPAATPWPAHRGPPGSGGVPADEDCVCCVIS